MQWFLISIAVVVVLTALHPITRRMWVFGLTAFKYVAIWLAHVVRLRHLWLKVAGRPVTPVNRPVLMRRFCEDMGPTFIKFGQIVASSSGMFPDRYVAEFQKCLDRVRPLDYSTVEAVIAAELGAERSAELEELEVIPLASASIAQVHAARLADGTNVVIKVQRPGIDKLVDADMKIMRAMAVVAAKFLKDAELANPVGIVEDFAATLREELDFRKEAENLERFNQIMGELGHQRIRAPVPQWGLTTARVLVMERFYGTRVDRAEEIAERGVNAEEALVQGLRAWFQCVVFYGFFHGDVHAGNLMLLDNEDLGFLDFGIVGRFDDRQRLLVTDYLVAFSTGDFRKLAEVIVEMGGVPDTLELESFAADLKETYAPMLKLSFAEINYADFLPGIQRVATRHRLKMPKEFVLITKQMLYFDRYAKLLAPTLNVFTDPRLLMSMMMDIQKARAELQAN